MLVQACGSAKPPRSRAGTHEAGQTGRLTGRQAATAKMTLIELAAIVIAIVFWPVTLCVLALYILLFWVAPVLLALALLAAAAIMGSPTPPTSPTSVYLMEPKIACFNSQKTQISCDTHESRGETFGIQRELPLHLWIKGEKFNSLAACQDRLNIYKSPDYLLRSHAEKDSFNWAMNQAALQSVCVAEDDPRMG